MSVLYDAYVKYVLMHGAALNFLKKSDVCRPQQHFFEAHNTTTLHYFPKKKKTEKRQLKCLKLVSKLITRCMSYLVLNLTLTGPTTIFYGYNGKTIVQHLRKSQHGD